MSRVFGCDPRLEAAIPKVLQQLGWWNRWAELGKAVVELSDIFNRTSDQTPWQSDRFRAAYLAYFAPLNSARLRAVFEECRNLEFPIFSTVTDFGAGMGTAELSWTLPNVREWRHCEASSQANALYKELSAAVGHTPSSLSTKIGALASTTVIASYVLNELNQTPNELFQAHSLIILEPSLQTTSRKLMELRSELIAKKFFIWAPCTHQNSCPLLTQSKRDWCHDRIQFSAPSWWPQLQPYVPMRNDTLTYSYLLAAKSPPAWISQTDRARVIGDTLFENGKIRQAVCRGTEREFLAWLKKDGEPLQIPHGVLVAIPEGTEKKGNELRPQNLISITR